MHVPENSASYKPSPHIPHQVSHGHSHRRTDSTSSGSGDTHHFRAQVPPTISQASIIPSLGVPVSVPYPQRPPIKSQGMGPINPPHHGHSHTHIPQWSQPSYVRREIHTWVPRCKEWNIGTNAHIIYSMCLHMTQDTTRQCTNLKFPPTEVSLAQ